jgi:hypothetical protein
MQDEASNADNGPRKWTRRAGIIAFLFFLGKGLVWLGIAAAGLYYSVN